jgi:hypothetical protein
MMRIHANMVTAMTPDKYEQFRRALEARRRRVRHLFRFRDPNGKMQWAKSWAKVSSVEARLREVKSSERPGQPDPFLYALYSWISSAVHGGPNSLKEVLIKRGTSFVAARQPEQDPKAQFVAGAAVLAWTLEAAIEDLQLGTVFGGEVNHYSATVQSLRGRRK